MDSNEKNQEIDMLKKIALPAMETVKSIQSEFPGTETRDVEVLFKILMFSQHLITIMEKHFGRYGLTKSKFHILAFLYFRRNQNDSDLSTLANMLCVTKSTVTGLIDGLEKVEIVERYTDKAKDRRKIFIRLTEKGVDMFRQVFPHHIHKVAGLLEVLDEKEAEIIIKAIAKLEDQLDKLTFEKYEFKEK